MSTLCLLPGGSTSPTGAATAKLGGKRNLSLLSNNIGKPLLSILHLFYYLILTNPHEVGIISCGFYRWGNWGACPSLSTGDQQSWDSTQFILLPWPVCLTLEPPTSTAWFALGLALPGLVQKSKTASLLLAQVPGPSCHRAKRWVGLGDRPRSCFH